MKWGRKKVRKKDESRVGKKLVSQLIRPPSRRSWPKWAECLFWKGAVKRNAQFICVRMWNVAVHATPSTPFIKYIQRTHHFERLFPYLYVSKIGAYTPLVLCTSMPLCYVSYIQRMGSSSYLLHPLFLTMPFSVPPYLSTSACIQFLCYRFRFFET